MKSLLANLYTGFRSLGRPRGHRLGVKLGQVAQPLRAALTGRSTSPGIFDVMGVLGREECLARLSDVQKTRQAISMP